MSSKNHGLLIGLLCYVMWGILPAFWNLLVGVDPFLILCARIVFAFIFMMCLIAVTGRMSVFLETLRDKKKVLYLIPCALLITFNWGLYIWAVNTGQIVYASLGYYMNPLIAFSFGVVFFRERCTRLQLVAVGLALIGVLISIIAYGRVPLISIGLGFSFAVYGAIKKKANADPNSGIAIESLLISPFALVFALVFMPDSVGAVNLSQLFLLIGGGVVTAVPLVLFSRAVNDIPLITVGFLQYIAPSLTLIYGLFIGLRPSESQIVTIIFIGMGLIVFSIALIRNAKAQSAVSAS